MNYKECDNLFWKKVRKASGLKNTYRLSKACRLACYEIGKLMLKAAGMPISVYKSDLAEWLVLKEDYRAAAFEMFDTAQFKSKIQEVTSSYPEEGK